jgi:hypothetical protein
MTVTVLVDVLILAILVYCGWVGCKKGLILGICNLIALVIAIYAANLLAVTYSGEFTGALSPFLSSMVDNAVVEVVRSETSDEPAADGEGLIASLIDGATADDDEDEDTSTVVDYRDAGTVREITVKTLQKLGITEGAAEKIAEETEAELEDDVASPAIKQIITEKLCDVIAFVALFAVAFMLIIIVFSVIENVINLEFRLPNMRYIDCISGTALGLARGFLAVLLVGWVMRYMGLLFKEDAMASTVFLKLAMNSDIISHMIGI